LPWKPEDLLASQPWFNPWPIKYLMSTFKWLPLYAPNESWETISFPPAFDEFGNRQGPKPPDGEAVYWWKLPKETWPYRDEMPWEPKILGAWQASQITMADDLPPSIWPGKPNVPPFGFIKLKMPGESDISGNQIAWIHMHIHARRISPDEMKVKTAITPLGPRYYLQSDNWKQYEYTYQQFRRAISARRRERFIGMVAEEIVRTKGKPKPSKDLFS
jgi:hypothetical protein